MAVLVDYTDLKELHNNRYIVSHKTQALYLPSGPDRPTRLKMPPSLAPPPLPSFLLILGDSLSL
jgi:hypothetical protein